MTRERWIAQLSLGVIAVHVVDDTYLQPQAGTSASDHLVGGAIQLFIVLALALAYPRLRAGVRAFAAATVGALAIAGGLAEAGYYTVHGGPSGDDFTGLAGVAAGAALVATGAVTLWRTRRRDDARLRRYARRALLTVGAWAFAIAVLYPVGLAYVATHASRASAAVSLLGARQQPVRLRTSDDLWLVGSYVPSRNGAAVIVSPGRSPAVQRHAALLIRHGYGVLIFDRRGEGGSEGEPNLLGWDGNKDLAAALHFVDSRPDVERGRIGGLGLSVGGEMLLQAAAESSLLRAVVSEGAGIRSFKEAVHLPWRHRWFDASFFAVATTATAVFANDTPPPDLRSVIPRIAPRPVFLISAEHGEGGETDLNPIFAGAADGPVTLWQVPGSSHTGGLTARPREYERRVIGFFERALHP